VFVTNDTKKESSETFNVILGNVSNGKLGSPASATVTILDDDKRQRSRVFESTRLRASMFQW
jgi:hypothetical protein